MCIRDRNWISVFLPLHSRLHSRALHWLLMGSCTFQPHRVASLHSTLKLALSFGSTIRKQPGSSVSLTPIVEWPTGKDRARIKKGPIVEFCLEPLMAG